MESAMRQPFIGNFYGGTIMFRKMILAVATAAALIVGFSFHAPEAQAQRWRGGYGPRTAYYGGYGRGYYGRGYYGGNRGAYNRPYARPYYARFGGYGPYGY
jgi:hypothetical protein